MPRFIKNGPMVPDKLVQELEEDRVILFCGAGISVGGGLPTFRQLVEHCYTDLGATMPPAKDPEWLWLDRMLGSLEADHPAQMRTRVVEALDKTATDLSVHDAILKLARLKGSNGIRLVTTNFDLFFEQARKGLALGVDYHSGPVLPIPRNDRISSWRSIVYLHGRLEPGPVDNQHLVLTSSDFGRAYLTDAWAARFVAKLFSEFTVLFVGYSLNDPVLRYMTDAFAAEDALTRSGRKRGPGYIFVPYKGTDQDPTPWRQRRLEPIFYRQPYGHRALTKTLAEWAKARGDYLASINTIVRRYGSRLPNALEPSYAANLVWAVCGRPGDSGHGARTFARLLPPAPIDWLFEFERHDAEAKAAHQQDVATAVAEELEPAAPPTYHIDALFPAANEAIRDTGLGDTSFELVSWLCAHLETEGLVSWVIQKLDSGRRPHPRLRRLIRHRLEAAPPIAAGFATFWRIVASEGEWTNNAAPYAPWADLFQNLASKIGQDWFDRELEAAMRPYIKLSSSFRAASGQSIDPTRISSIAHVEVELAHDNPAYLIERLNSVISDDQFWSDRLEWLTALLRQVLELFAVAGRADAISDPTAMQRPSIIPHPQNRNHAKWSLVFDLIWRGWARIDAVSSSDSRAWIIRWREMPYLGFRRLALAAISVSPHFSPAEKLEALLNG